MSIPHSTLKHFKTSCDVLAYIIDELVDTLQIDATRMKDDDVDANGVQEIENKIADIKALENLVANAADLFTEVQKAVAKMEAAGIGFNEAGLREVLNKITPEPKNTNCLEGMRCPECQSLEPFAIQIKTVATVYDSGTNATENHEWEDYSPCICEKCGHSSTVRAFKV